MVAFSKQLTQEDVEKRLSVPVEWLTIFPSFGEDQEIQLQVVDRVGMFWEFFCVIQIKAPHWSPVLKPEGWLQFVNYTGLRVGDKIIIYEEENKFRETKYRIIAQRLNCDGHWINIS